MIDLYYWPTPNGHNITLFLEEAERDYTIKPVNIGEGEQFAPDFSRSRPKTRCRQSSITRMPKAGRR